MQQSASQIRQQVYRHGGIQQVATRCDEVFKRTVCPELSMYKLQGPYQESRQCRVAMRYFMIAWLSARQNPWSLIAGKRPSGLIAAVEM